MWLQVSLALLLFQELEEGFDVLLPKVATHKGSELLLPPRRRKRHSFAHEAVGG